MLDILEAHPALGRFGFDRAVGQDPGDPAATNHPR